MKLFKKFSLILLSTLIFAGSAFIFAGCERDDDISKLYVFASVGGCVQVDDNKEVVEFGDEGSKIFTYKEDSIVTLKAIPNEDYCFVEWKFTDDLVDDYASVKYQSEIKIKLDDEEVVVRAEFALDSSITKYNVTYPTSTTGYLIVPETGYSSIVREGSDFKFKVNLEADYSNSNIVVKANNNEITADSNGIYTLSNINEDIAIIVSGVELNKEEPPVDPTPDPTIFGVFTLDSRIKIIPIGQDTCEVVEGNSFTFKIEIIDETKYKFGSNLVVKASGGVLIGNNGQYTINSVTRNTPIVVEGIVPVVNVYTIVAENGGGFEIVPKSHPTCEVAEGETFKFEVRAQEGFALDSMIIVTVKDELLMLENGVYTIEDIRENIIVKVEGIYEVRKVFTNSALFTILAKGQSTANSNWIVTKGESFEFKIEVAEGYKLGDSVIVRADGMDLTEDKGYYTIYQVNNDLEITVEGIETIGDYTISKNDTTFSIKPISHSTCNVTEGQSFSFEIELDDSYQAEDIKVFANGVELVNVDGIYTIDSVTSDIVITIEGISVKTYTISTQETTYSINPIGQNNYVVNHNENFIFEIEVKTGYQFGSNVKVLANGTELVSNNGQYTISNVTENIEIVVQGVELKTYTIWFVENDNYTINPVSQQGFVVVYGGSFTFSVSINEGYVAENDFEVTVNGTPLTADNGHYTISNIVDNIQIEVRGIEQLFSYEFSIDFANSIKTFAPNILTDLGIHNIKFDIKESDKTKTIFELDEFTITAGEGQDMTMAEFVELINDVLTLYSFNNMSYFSLGGLEFISIGQNDITINWNVLDIANYDSLEINV